MKRLTWFEFVGLGFATLMLAESFVAANTFEMQSSHGMDYEAAYSEVLGHSNRHEESDHPSVSKHDERLERFRDLNMTRERAPN